MKHILKTRGFSLVELMVVVAIMGTLATIAIPSYNSYRKSAKKTAYRTDALSLHKGLLAFGVELDSFCSRDTTPKQISFSNVGMDSLLNSSLYGTKPDKENFIGFSGTDSSCDLTAWDPTPSKYKTTGARTNGEVTAPSTTQATYLLQQREAIRMVETAADHPAAAQCQLSIAEYEIGVAGHISRNKFIGFSVNENGVVTEEPENTWANIKGTSGVCT